MKIHHCVLLVILCLITAGLCGCTEQQPTSINGDIKTSVVDESFTVDALGGRLTTKGDEIQLTISSYCVETETTITIKTIQDKPDHTDATFIVGYEFTPDGLQFKKPVSIQIYYKDADIPAGVDEDTLRLYLYQNDQPSEIYSHVYPEYNYISAQISHFCYYWVASPKTSSSSNGSNTSAVYQFEVPVQFGEKERIDNPDEVISPYHSYSYYAYFAWDPQPLVRYYEVTLHMHNNTAKPYKFGYSWREQNYDHIGPEKWVKDHENDLYILGEYKYYPGYGKYHGTSEIGETAPDMHGITIFGVQDNFNLVGDLYETMVTADQIKTYKEEMKLFVEEYVHGWTVTVRAVT